MALIALKRLQASVPSQDLQHFCWLVFDLLQKGWLLPSPVLDVVLQYLGVRFGSGSLAQVAAEGFDEVLSTIQKDGRLTLTGRNCEEHDVPEGLPPAKALAAGFFHTCLLTMKHEVVCFGDNSDGQCDVPAALGPAAVVAAGGYHTCVVTSDGSLVCFGDNSLGQCDVPQDLGPVTFVAAGFEHTCAVTAKGRLICFGGNHEGQCDVPLDLGPVVSVAAGSHHTCALLQGGQVVCFGRLVAQWYPSQGLGV
ncbi:HERC6 [Symbiodinium natans]|uniref:HERC6 protein n=1 Tax=Symbiodinium natans TaxID=878477 RepID=A0A812Q4S6_9DINO|nr:HERC6 [Symbiodinium natans]